MCRTKDTALAAGLAPALLPRAGTSPAANRPNYANMPTQLITRSTEIRKAIVHAQQGGETVGLVPTMGALHEGHLSLVDASLDECDRTVVTIFVNPTQFGPGEDYQRYPRPLEEDVEMLRERGCWLVFAPEVEEMYPTGHETFVDVGSIRKPLEGAARPMHFFGVATVVLKLLNMAPADRAYFGKKDYQQTLVIRKLATDLNVPTEIRVCPTLREPNGMAMSSRNEYLSQSDRQRAVALSQSLQQAAEQHERGETDVAKLRENMLRTIDSAGGVKVEYIAFVAAGTVDEVKTVEGPTVIAIAARVGTTRLIDNWQIG